MKLLFFARWNRTVLFTFQHEAMRTQKCSMPQQLLNRILQGCWQMKNTKTSLYSFQPSWTQLCNYLVLDTHGKSINNETKGQSSHFKVVLFVESAKASLYLVVRDAVFFRRSCLTRVVRVCPHPDRSTKTSVYIIHVLLIVGRLIMFSPPWKKKK